MLFVAAYVAIFGRFCLQRNPHLASILDEPDTLLIEVHSQAVYFRRPITADVYFQQHEAKGTVKKRQRDISEPIWSVS